VKFFLYLKILCLFILLMSCASPPKQLYLKSGKISEYSNIALNVVSTDINIKYESDANTELLNTTPFIVKILFPLPTLLITSAVDGASDLIRDSEITDDVRLDRGKYYYDIMLKNTFLEQIGGTKFSQMIDYTNIIDVQKLSYDGYDALIFIQIKDLYLKKDFNNKMYIYTRIIGKMIDIRKEEKIWQREEYQQSKDSYSIEELKTENGRKLLSTIRKLFEKISNRLVIDIFYN
jgi:hypothetical protein